MDELLKLLAIPSHTGHCDLMYNYILDYGNSHGWLMESDKTGNLYATKGQSVTYPCVVSHMDTVHRIKEGGITPVLIDGKIIGINPFQMDLTGIGGDDKCGIWACIHNLTVLPACKAAFFVDEERGCVGSGACDISWFADCRYVLQADRRGNTDFVTDIYGPLSSDSFLSAVAPIIKDYGYKHSDGMMTDVRELRDQKIGLSLANMSAGYWNPHSDREYIDVHDLSNVCAMMQEIFEKVTDVFPFEHKPKVYITTGGTAKGGKLQSWLRGEKGECDQPTDFSHYDPFPDYGGAKEGATVHGKARCDYCGTLADRDQLMEYGGADKPSVCIDCAIHKEQKGFYPITGISKFWQRLEGKGYFRRKKRQKKKKKQRFSGFNNNGSSNNGSPVTQGADGRLQIQKSVPAPKAEPVKPGAGSTEASTSVNDQYPLP